MQPLKLVLLTLLILRITNMSTQYFTGTVGYTEVVSLNSTHYVTFYVSSSNIYGRIYDQRGIPATTTITINTSPSVNYISIAVLSNCNFVVVYQSGTVGKAQIVDKNGNKVGSEFTVFADCGGAYPRVSSLPNDKFVVVAAPSIVSYVIFHNDGTIFKSETSVVGSSSPNSVAVGFNKNGRFAVSWYDTSVGVCIYDAQGNLFYPSAIRITSSTSGLIVKINGMNDNDFFLGFKSTLGGLGFVILEETGSYGSYIPITSANSASFFAQTSAPSGSVFISYKTSSANVYVAGMDKSGNILAFDINFGSSVTGSYAPITFMNGQLIVTYAQTTGAFINLEDVRSSFSEPNPICLYPNYLYANLSCLPTCKTPILQNPINPSDICQSICVPTSFLYINGTCSPTCPSPFVQTIYLGQKICSCPVFSLQSGGCSNYCPGEKINVTNFGIICLTPADTSSLNKNQTCPSECWFPSMNVTIASYTFCQRICPVFYNWNHSCVDTCNSPGIPQTTVYGDLCNYPCANLSLFYTWTGHCNATCPSPATIDSTTGFCNYPCPSTTQFLTWNNQCSFTCLSPFIRNITNNVKTCELPCSNISQYYTWNNQCSNACLSPFIINITNDINLCQHPCAETSQFYGWDSLCTNTCEAPYISNISNGFKYCDFPCSNSSNYFTWNNQCIGDCLSPFISNITINGYKRCNHPCLNVSQFYSWNNQCLDTCDSPFISNITNEFKYCGPPCVNTSQFYTWDDKCNSTCPPPLTSNVTNQVKLCNHPCFNTSQFYGWNNQCSDECLAPFIVNISYGIKICNYPCSNHSHFYTWNNQCSINCLHPFISNISIYGLKMCNHPCSNTSQFYSWNNQCINFCHYPLIQNLSNGFKSCDHPCSNISQYYTWNNQCSSTCNYPLVLNISNGLKFCEYPCLNTSQYYTWYNQCSNDCNSPFIANVTNGLKFCGHPCLNSSHFFSWNNQCSATCLSPFISNVSVIGFKVCNHPCGNTSQFYSWKNDCLDSCLSPFIVNITNGFKYCFHPCSNISQFFTWNNQCSTTCTLPFISNNTNGFKTCSHPCSDNSQYYTWDSLCSDNCQSPFVSNVSNGLKICNHPCSNISHYYTWNNQCSANCIAPLISNITNGFKFCSHPCINNSHYFTWYNQCSENCHYPSILNITNGLKLCNNPCSNTSDFFYPWINQCSDLCLPPFIQTFTNEIRVCSYPCANSSFFYNWNNSCVLKCLPPFILNSSMGLNLCQFPCTRAEFLSMNNTCITDCLYPYKSYNDSNYSFCTECQLNYQKQNDTCFLMTLLNVTQSKAAPNTLHLKFNKPMNFTLETLKSHFSLNISGVNYSLSYQILDNQNVLMAINFNQQLKAQIINLNILDPYNMKGFDGIPLIFNSFLFSSTDIKPQCSPNCVKCINSTACLECNTFFTLDFKMVCIRDLASFEIVQDSNNPNKIFLKFNTPMEIDLETLQKKIIVTFSNAKSKILYNLIKVDNSTILLYTNPTGNFPAQIITVDIPKDAGIQPPLETKTKSEFIMPLLEDREQIIRIRDIISSPVSSFVLVATMILKPQLFWRLIVSGQYYNYLNYLNTDLPSNLYNWLQPFKFLNFQFIFLIPEGILLSNRDNYLKFKEQGIGSSFLYNSFVMLVLLLGLLILLGISLAFLKDYRVMFYLTKLIIKIRTNISLAGIIVLWRGMILNLTTYAILQILHPAFHTNADIISYIMAIIYLAIAVFLKIKIVIEIYNRKNKTILSTSIRKREKHFYIKISEKIKPGKAVAYVIGFDYLKIFLFGFFSVVFYHVKYLQMISLSLLSFSSGIYHLVYKPYLDRNENFILIIEGLFVGFAYFLSVFIKTSQDDIDLQLKLGWCIFVIYIGNVVIAVCSIIYHRIRNSKFGVLCLKMKKKTRTRMIKRSKKTETDQNKILKNFRYQKRKTKAK